MSSQNKTIEELEPKVKALIEERKVLKKRMREAELKEYEMAALLPKDWATMDLEQKISYGTNALSTEQWDKETWDYHVKPRVKALEFAVERASRIKARRAREGDESEDEDREVFLKMKSRAMRARVKSRAERSGEDKRTELLSKIGAIYGTSSADIAQARSDLIALSAGDR